jgi:hypothetical protein
VLKSGGRAGVFDIMQLVPEIPASGLPFPMPWASTTECSFVRKPESYKQSASHTYHLMMRAPLRILWPQQSTPRPPAGWPRKAYS